MCNDNLLKIENFINESPMFMSIYGHYDMSTDLFMKSLKNYLETGYNGIKEYQSLAYISGFTSSDPLTNAIFNSQDHLFSNDEIMLMDSCIKNETFWSWTNFFDSIEELTNLHEYARCQRDNLNSYKERRRKANINNGKDSVRKQVFSRDGYQCNMCKSTSNLSIDHIVPVSKGGGNELDNLQCLCKPCNSKKGVKNA